MKRFLFVVMVVALGATSSLALATGKPGSQVRGAGKVQIGDSSTTSVSHISVNAWADSAGVARGSLEWTGGVSATTKPPAYPWHMQVTSIDVAGNTATVCWVVVSAPDPTDVGTEGCMNFSDSAPDTIQVVFAPSVPDSPSPLLAGNIIVR